MYEAGDSVSGALWRPQFDSPHVRREAWLGETRTAKIRYMGGFCRYGAYVKAAAPLIQDSYEGSFWYRD